MEGHVSELPIQFRDDLTYNLGSSNRSRDDVLGSLSAIMPWLPRGNVHSLLCSRIAWTMVMILPHDAKVVIDGIGQGTKQLCWRHC